MKNAALMGGGFAIRALRRFPTGIQEKTFLTTRGNTSVRTYLR